MRPSALVRQARAPAAQACRAGNAAPYDVIFLNGATEIAPDALRRRLKEAAGSSASWAAPTGQAMLYRSVGGDVSAWPIFDAAAPVLPGFVGPPAFVF